MIIGHPGTWQQFQSRSDNRNLSIMEMKSKYLHEQYLFEAQMLSLQQLHQQNTFMNGAGGGPSPSSEPTYLTELVFGFNSNPNVIGDGTYNSLSWWNSGGGPLTFEGGAPSFGTIIVNTDNNTVTLKGNQLGLTLTTDSLSGNTDLYSIEDINSNCLTIIEDGVFDGSTIERVILNAVTTVGDNAFANSSLISIYMEALTSIGNRALSVCNQLTDLRFISDCTFGTDVFLNSLPGGSATVNNADLTDPNIIYLGTDEPVGLGWNITTA